MSAIWGCIGITNHTYDKPLKKMSESYHKYKIDKIYEFKDEELALGCGIQNFTDYSAISSFPSYTNDNNSIFVADVVIDNREELMSYAKQLPNRELSSDIELMHHIVNHPLEEVLSKIKGVFAFCSYDKKKRETILGVDPLGNRCLYYGIHNGTLYFSTTIQAIIDGIGTQVNLNERWISDYLAMDFLGLVTEAEETYIQNIYKVPPGHYIQISRNGLKKVEYWKAKNYISCVPKSDAEIKQSFLNIYKNSVESILHFHGETGILLSSGLDSTSVACLAAPELKRRDKNLYSFTAIPLEEYTSTYSKSIIVNETELMDYTLESYTNIIPTYISLPNKNCWDGMDELSKQLEVPVKSLQNIQWMYESLKEASKIGCKVMLNGQNGNCTVSFGDYGLYYNTLLKKRKISKLFSEFERPGLSKTQVLKKVSRYIIHEVKQSYLIPRTNKKKMFEKSYLNHKLISKYSIERRFRKLGYNVSTKGWLSIDKVKNKLVNKETYSVIGEMDTKLSLLTGVLMRDPTRDPALIEFCLGLSEEQFVYQGVNRRLIKEYMRDYIPKEILQYNGPKALQSADIFYRLSKDWDRIYDEIIQYLNSPLAKMWLDTDKIKLDLETYRQPPEAYNFQFLKIIYSVLLMKFIKE